jgi:hypothetical protein
VIQATVKLLSGNNGNMISPIFVLDRRNYSRPVAKGTFATDGKSLKAKGKKFLNVFFPCPFSGFCKKSILWLYFVKVQNRVKIPEVSILFC